MSKFLNANEARKITEAALQLPTYIDAAFETIRSAAAEGLYGVQIDFSFIDVPYSEMSEEQALVRGKIIEKLKAAHFRIQCYHYESDSPSIYVDWSEAVPNCD